MSRRKSSTLFLRLAVVSAGFWLAGCAAPSSGLSPDQAVRPRAEQRIQAMVKGDLAALYELTAPSYRKLKSVDAFKSRFGTGATWAKADMAKVDCEPERCTVDLIVEVKPLIRGRNVGTIAMPVQDVWLLEDGKWWLYQGL